MASARQPYGPLLPSLWTGETGLALQEMGPSAVILATFLMSNPWSNMIGLYRLTIDDIVHSLPVILVDARGRRIRRHAEQLAFVRALLDRLGTDLVLNDPDLAANDPDLAATWQFSIYDDHTRTVFVREAAKFRLQLDDDLEISTGDKRLIAIRRLYNLTPASRCKNAFYVRYARQLRLQDARSPIGSPSQNDHEAPSDAPSEPLSKPPVYDSTVQRTVQAVQAAADAATTFPQPVENSAKSVGSYAFLLKVVHTVIDEKGLLGEGELEAEVKDRCGELRVGYWSEQQSIDVLHRAVAAARMSRSLGLGGAR